MTVIEGGSLFPKFDGPLLFNAAGTVKSPDQAKELLRADIPAVTLGSYTVEERAGNAGRTFYESPVAALNSMGLPGPELAVWSSWVREIQAAAHDSGKQIWVSVAGFNPPEYRIMADAALEAGADAVELNLGCPNIWFEGEQKPIVSFSVEQTALVCEEISALGNDGLIGVKLSPILDNVLLHSIDAVLHSANIGFVTTMNTVPNCFAFAEDGKPAITLGKGLAGLSGPATKWIALGQVIAHREALPSMPVIGVGGIASGGDLRDYLESHVNAAACQVATAFWSKGTRVFGEIVQSYAELLSDV